jgi:hypothetical protein
MSEHTPPLSNPARIAVELKDTSAPGNRQALIDLERQSFEIAFETALERLADGLTLSEFCANYPSPVEPLSAVRFRTWIFRDPQRKSAYMTAKAIGAETVEDDLIRIADGLRPDGTASLDDVPRSQLRVQTRKWLLQVWNRRRYGDVKQIEQTTTTTVDISNLSTEELRSRLLKSLGMDADPSGNTYENSWDE